MECEWREVRRRGVDRPKSESAPVRHSNYPSHRCYPRQQPIGRWNGDWQAKQQEDTSHGVDCVTFFFTNFPEGCWVETLTRSFSQVGKVLDVFCPKKRDLRGKPFGFVRFEDGVDKERVLAELNNIWIGSYKIRAYVPRFDRPAQKEMQGKPKGAAKEEENKEQNETSKGKIFSFQKGVGKLAEPFWIRC